MRQKKWKYEKRNHLLTEEFFNENLRSFTQFFTSLKALVFCYEVQHQQFVWSQSLWRVFCQHGVDEFSKLFRKLLFFRELDILSNLRLETVLLFYLNHIDPWSKMVRFPAKAHRLKFQWPKDLLFHHIDCLGEFMETNKEVSHKRSSEDLQGVVYWLPIQNRILLRFPVLSWWLPL